MSTMHRLRVDPLTQFSKTLKCASCAATFYNYFWLMRHEAAFHVALWPK